VFLQVLKQGLERHPGVDSRTLSITVPCPIAPEAAWRRLLPSNDPVPGHRYSLVVSPEATAEGWVRSSHPPISFMGVAENLDDGLIGLYCGFRQQFVDVTLVLWGPIRDRAPEIEAAWTSALNSALGN
jgi:hypothetical protein